VARTTYSHAGLTCMGDLCDSSSLVSGRTTDLNGSTALLPCGTGTSKHLTNTYLLLGLQCSVVSSLSPVDYLSLTDAKKKLDLGLKIITALHPGLDHECKVLVLAKCNCRRTILIECITSDVGHALVLTANFLTA